MERQAGCLSGDVLLALWHLSLDRFSCSRSEAQAVLTATTFCLAYVKIFGPHRPRLNDANRAEHNVARCVLFMSLIRGSVSDVLDIKQSAKIVVRSAPFGKDDNLPIRTLVQCFGSAARAPSLAVVA